MRIFLLCVFTVACTPAQLEQAAQLNERYRRAKEESARVCAMLAQAPEFPELEQAREACRRLDALP